MSTAAPRSKNGSPAVRETATDQFLTFLLAQEAYGIDILRVQEIKGWTPVTRIPNAPEFLRGILNLRGTIVPVLDLRLRFGLEQVEYLPTTVVIVVAVKGATGNVMIGLVVDGVSDVVTINRDEIRPAPNFGTIVATDYIEGLAATDRGMLMLLDIDRLFSAQELQAIDAIAQ